MTKTEMVECEECGEQHESLEKVQKGLGEMQTLATRTESGDD